MEWIWDIAHIVDRPSQQQLEAGGSDGAAAVAAGGAGGGAGHRHQHPHVPPHPRHAQHCQGQVQVGFGVWKYTWHLTLNACGRHRHQGPKSLEISDLYGENDDVTEDEVTEAEEATDTTDTTESGAADLGSGEVTSAGQLGQDAVMWTPDIYKYLLINTAAATILFSTRWQSIGHMQDVHLYTFCKEIVSVNKTFRSEVMSLHYF